MKHSLNFALATSILALAAGCAPEAAKSITRFHLQNESGSPLTFLAIDLSEAAVSTAENRLPGPLEPNAVYSAALSRPGNYWVRTEIESAGYVIERIEGPVRISRGVCDWRFTRIDARPLYPQMDGGGQRKGKYAAGAGLALIQDPAGRMSFNSNWMVVSPRQ